MSGTIVFIPIIRATGGMPDPVDDSSYAAWQAWDVDDYVPAHPQQFTFTENYCDGPFLPLNPTLDPPF